ncbi:threonine synthase [Halobacillus massiliensis]|uniref:threonine synthase n=1 Tax=Halobacillus massiliensis TaxID=1926286 RepID=UPI0009E3C6D6|nr:threonine synthase [Halobacillus massiliensis]
MNVHYQCHTCGTTYKVNPYIWKCTCGGVFDLIKGNVSFSASMVDKNTPSMWRYNAAMPIDRTFWKNITMGEGNTPLIPLEENVQVKVDYMMPTLSFKDRGAAALISKAKEMGVEHVIADSSGNAGTAIAAYAKRANISCDIFLGEGTSDKKMAQVKAHGADIRVVKGSREDVAEAAKRAVEEEGKFYASHVYNPFFYEGTKTYAYEIWEQLDEMPDTLIIPVGNGTLLLGVYYGCKELLENGLIDKLPKIIAIQAENCAPIAKAFTSGEQAALPVENTGTLAEGIAIARPARAATILEAVRQTDGQFLTVDEEEIAHSRSVLAGKGFYVEPTTAANYAGFLKYNRSMNEKVIIPLCGAGIKV